LRERERERERGRMRGGERQRENAIQGDIQIACGCERDIMTFRPFEVIWKSFLRQVLTPTTKFW